MKHYLWELRPYFRQVAGQLVVGSVGGILMNTAIVLPPILLGRAIDVAWAMSRGQASRTQVATAALLFVVGTLATEGPRIVKRWFLMTANARIRANIRADAFRGILAWPMESLHRVPVGDLMARMVGDVEVLGTGVREFTIETWDTVLFSVSLVVAMFFLDPLLSTLALLPVPFALLLSKVSGKWIARRVAAAREANADLTAFIQEHLAGVRVLKLFGRTGAAVDRVRGLARKQAGRNLDVVRLRAGLQPAYMTMMTAGVVFTIWMGGERVLAGAMTIGGLVAYLQLYLRFIERGFRIPQMINSIQAGGAPYSRLRPLMAPALPVRGEMRFSSFKAGYVAGTALPPETPAARSTGPVEVSLQNVTFVYPGAHQPALRGLTLEIPRGSLVGITGPVGCGKSALARALLGIYPLQAGTILLDGTPLAELAPLERVARIGYLPQDPYLFSGSIADNIVFMDPKADHSPPSSGRSTVDRAIATASLEEDIASLPAGVHTQIGELGIRVSGGQRQRIGLARAMAAPLTPGLLVLDDPFSAVDVDTEAQIASTLRRAFGKAAPPEARATIVLCSHRLAAFPQADLIVVLESGQIAEMGTHSALLEKRGLYSRIFKAQSKVMAGASP